MQILRMQPLLLVYCSVLKTLKIHDIDTNNNND